MLPKDLILYILKFQEMFFFHRTLINIENVSKHLTNRPFYTFDRYFYLITVVIPIHEEKKYYLKKTFFYETTNRNYLIAVSVSVRVIHKSTLLLFF